MTDRASALRRIILLGLLLVAFWLRIHQLATAPPGLYYDEAAHGLDALQVWQGRLYIFFPTAGGHEPLFTYLVSGFVAFLGNTILAIRLPAAFLGTLAVAACYALGKGLLGQRQAIFASGLVAVTFWTVSLSRIGYRANALPVLFLLWLLAFWRCRNRHDWQPYVLAGFLLGLMQYTYTAARFAPLLALILAFDWRKTLSIRGLGAGAAVAALVTAPLALAVVLDPAAGTDRLRHAWLFSRPEPLQLFWRQLQGHLLMFGFSGDPLWIHNIPFRPPVALPLAILCGLGLVLGWRNPVTRTLIFAISVMLWPGILAVSNNPAPPDHLRVLVIAAPVFLLVAAGLNGLIRQRAQLAAFLMLTLFVIDAGISWQDYQRWSTARETYEQFDADMTRLAVKIASHPNLFYVIPISPDWHEFKQGKQWTIEYLTHSRPNYNAVTVPYVLPELPSDNIALVKWQAGMHLSADPQRTLEGELNLLGYAKIGEETENTFLLEYYRRSGQPVEVFRFTPNHVYEGGLRVTGLNLYLSQQDNGQLDKLMAEVLWEGSGAYANPIAISLRLQTPDGALAGQVDSALWNDLGETAEKWRAQEHSRLFLELDASQLSPAPYTVTLFPYDTVSLSPLPSLAGQNESIVGTIQVR